MTVLKERPRQGEALYHKPTRPVGTDVVLGAWCTVGTALFGAGAALAGAWQLTLAAWLVALLAAAYTAAVRRSDRRPKGKTR